MKICKTCKIEKNSKEFGPHKNTKDNLATNCRKCDAERVKKYQKNNPIKTKESNFNKGIKKHGITPEQYNKMLKKNNGVCYLCNKKDFDRRLSIDHDHSCCPKQFSCGKCIRGLLCYKCNMAIGQIEKNKISINKIIEYLAALV